MAAAVVRFFRNESGSTAIEYAIIGSLVSVAIVVAATSIGTKLNGLIAAIVPNFD